MSRQSAPSSSADQTSPGSGGLDGPSGPATSAGAAVRLWRCFRGLPTTMLIGALAAVDCCVTLLVSTARADPTKYTTFSDVTYVVRDGQSLKADVYQPVGDGPFPGVLCVHGGGWISGNKSHMVALKCPDTKINHPSDFTTIRIITLADTPDKWGAKEH